MLPHYIRNEIEIERIRIIVDENRNRIKRLRDTRTFALLQIPSTIEGFSKIHLFAFLF